MKKDKIKVLFSQAHNEQLSISEDAEDEVKFLLLRQELENLGFEIDYTIEAISSDMLADAQILVVGAPMQDRHDPKLADLDPAEIDTVMQFVANGGGLFLISNADTMIDPSSGLKEIATIVGL